MLDLQNYSFLLNYWKQNLCRCVYRFGKNASDWKPYPGEISTGLFLCLPESVAFYHFLVGVTMNLLGGKRFFPNQETWPRSRFYNDFNKSPTLLTTMPRTNPAPVVTLGASVTTLFTITPLDSSATNFSEMKVTIGIDLK